MRGMDLDHIKRKKDEGRVQLRKNVREEVFMKRRNFYDSDPYKLETEKLED